MSTMKEVKTTIKIVKKYNKNIAITQCTSSYPCPPKISDIGVIPEYIRSFKIVTGLSTILMVSIIIGSVALGARIIEKHFTLNKKVIGPDQYPPHELKSLVEVVM